MLHYPPNSHEPPTPTPVGWASKVAPRRFQKLEFEICHIAFVARHMPATLHGGSIEQRPLEFTVWISICIMDGVHPQPPEEPWVFGRNCEVALGIT